METAKINTLLKPQVERYQENKRRYLLKKYKDKIKEDEVLLSVDKILIGDPKTIEKLTQLCKKIFIIKDEENFSEQIRSELSGVKDQFINAINSKSSGKIADFSKIYKSLAEAFLESLKESGSGYTSEQAKQERSAIFGGWNEIKWIKRDVFDVFDRSMESHDKGIIASLGFLPISIARNAIIFKDHYLFQEFIEFAVYLYRASRSETNPGLKSFMVDRSWRYIKEIADVYVESKLEEKGQTKEALLSLKDFAIYFIIIFQNLLREAYLSDDFGTFKQFKKSVNQLFDDFQPSHEYLSIDDLKRQIDNEELPENQKGELQKQIKEKELLICIENEIKDRKKQMFFGLASWLLEEWKKEPKNDNIKNFYLETESILPNELRELTEIFLSAHKSEVEDFWGWTWWGVVPEGEFYFVDALGNLVSFYCVKALRILKDKSEKEIIKKELPYNRHLAYLAEHNGLLIKILNNIKSNPANWSFVLSDEEMKKISPLKKVLEKAKKKQEEVEKEYKKKTKISTQKVDEFKDKVIEGFDESVVLRSIFQEYNLYEDHTSQKYEDLPMSGINIVDDKAAFFIEWHIDYFNWGINYGRNLSLSEDSILFEKIASQCRETKGENIEESLDKLSNLSDGIILLTKAAFYTYFKYLKNFKPAHYQNTPKLNVRGYVGRYLFQGRYIPTFKISIRKTDRQIVILDKSKLGKLLQYSPLNPAESKKLKKDIFYMNIQEFSENPDLMDSLIKESPEWLKKMGTEEEQREYLREKVLIKIYERFEFSKHKVFEGYLINIPNDKHKS